MMNELVGVFIVLVTCIWVAIASACDDWLWPLRRALWQHGILWNKRVAKKSDPEPSLLFSKRG